MFSEFKAPCNNYLPRILSGFKVTRYCTIFIKINLFFRTLITSPTQKLVTPTVVHGILIYYERVLVRQRVFVIRITRMIESQKYPFTYTESY